MSEDQKVKTAAGKVPMSMIPLYALQGCARVFGYGAKKYAPGNWYNADDEEAIARYAGAFIRHVMECQRPDGLWDLAAFMHLDEESGLPAIDHALCGLIMIRAIAVKRGMLADPGPGKEPPTKAVVPTEVEELATAMEHAGRDRLGDVFAYLTREEKVAAIQRGFAAAEQYQKALDEVSKVEIDVARYWENAGKKVGLDQIIAQAQDLVATPRFTVPEMTLERAKEIYDTVEAESSLNEGVEDYSESDFPYEDEYTDTDEFEPCDCEGCNEAPFVKPPDANESGDSYLAHQLLWVWPTQRRGRHVYRIWDTQTGQYVETEPLPNAEADELQGLAYLVDLVEA